MPEVQVSLDFACCTCDGAVSVTVKCTGKGLLGGSRTVAAVNVPCPNCGNVNRLCFEPCGIVREVLPCPIARPTLEPSVN